MTERKVVIVAPAKGEPGHDELVDRVAELLAELLDPRATPAEAHLAVDAAVESGRG